MKDENVSFTPTISLEQILIEDSLDPQYPSLEFEDFKETEDKQLFEESIEEPNKKENTISYFEETKTLFMKKKTLRYVGLLVCAIFTMLLWRIPFGNYVLYPFTILATWFHEMSHGLTALLSGFTFEKLILYEDGSGVAYYYTPQNANKLKLALVAAMGPMSGPIVGSFFILIRCLHLQMSRVCLILLSICLMLSDVFVVRSNFGLIIVGLLALIFLIVGVLFPLWFQVFFVDFLGTQICISTFSDIDYIFTYQVEIDGKKMLSDTGAIQQNLLLPYWFWASSMIAVSIFLLTLSLYISYKKHED
eukprot:gene6822-10987_t